MSIRRTKPKAKRSRNKERTRAAILAAAFAEIYRHGYQGASVTNVLRAAGLTKGALFHHFPSKKALGYAVVDEVVERMIRAQWVEPLAASEDAPRTLLEEFRKGIDFLEANPPNLGCPLNNLAQEMSPIDRGFRRRTQRVFALWIGAFERALERERWAGRLKASVNPRDTAVYLVSQIEGLLSLSKNAQSVAVLRTGWRGMKGFLESLKPRPFFAARPKRSRRDRQGGRGPRAAAGR